MKEVDRVYNRLLTRAIRSPSSTGKRARVPKLFAFAELPVPKREKTSLSAVSVNDGLHVHALLLFPWPCRLGKKPRLVAHLRERRRTYLGNHGKLRHVHVKPIKETPERVTDYITKGLCQPLPYEEAVLILPRSKTELHQSRA